MLLSSVKNPLQPAIFFCVTLILYLQMFSNHRSDQNQLQLFLDFNI